MVARTDYVPDGFHQPLSRLGRNNVSMRGKGRPMRVLIVEDELITARDLAETIGECGHDVVGIASSHDAALRAAEEHAPDLVFVDISIRGDKDGITLARNLREESAARIIFLTALNDRGVIDRVKAVRPDGFVVKPFSFDSIYSAIELSGSAELPAPPAFTPQKSSRGPGLHSAVRDEVVRHIERNFNRDLPMAELAGVAGLSTDYFSQCFRESLGQTPHQFVTRMRLEEAKHLLRHSRFSIGEIAQMVGYNSQAHFTTLFRRTYEVTPSGYRNG